MESGSSSASDENEMTCVTSARGEIFAALRVASLTPINVLDVVPCLARGGLMHNVKIVALPRAQNLVATMSAESGSGVSAPTPDELDKLFAGRSVAESYARRALAKAIIRHGPRGLTQIGRARRRGNKAVARLVEKFGCLTEYLQVAHAIFEPFFAAVRYDRLLGKIPSIVIAAVIVTHMKNRAAAERDWWKQENNQKSVSKLAQSMALTGASEDDNIAKTFGDSVVILGTLFLAGVSAEEVSQHWTEMARADDAASCVYHTQSEIDTFVRAAESILVETQPSADSRDECLALTAAVTLQKKAASLSHAVRPKKGHLVRMCNAVDAFAYVEEDDFLYTVLYRYALTAARLWNACTSLDLAELKARYDFIKSSDDIAMSLRFYIFCSRHTTPSGLDIGTGVELALSAYNKMVGQKRRERH
jgi:hypothetical protein